MPRRPARDGRASPPRGSRRAPGRGSGKPLRSGLESLLQDLQLHAGTATPQVDQDRQDQELVPEADLHVVLPEALVHAGAARDSISTWTRTSISLLHRDLGQEVELPPVAVGQSVKISLSTKMASPGRRRRAESGAARRRKSGKKVEISLFESWSWLHRTFSEG